MRKERKRSSDVVEDEDKFSFDLNVEELSAASTPMQVVEEELPSASKLESPSLLPTLSRRDSLFEMHMAAEQHVGDERRQDIEQQQQREIVTRPEPSPSRRPESPKQLSPALSTRDEISVEPESSTTIASITPSPKEEVSMETIEERRPSEPKIEEKSPPLEDS